MADESRKRKQHPTSDKHGKHKKQWRTPKQSTDGTGRQQGQSILPGDAGIWATCEKGREAKAVGELKDLLAESAEELYGADALSAAASRAETGTHQTEQDNETPQSDTSKVATDGRPSSKPEANDIESSIAAELSQLRTPTSANLFTNIRIDMPCVLFVRTLTPPIDPAQLARHICQTAVANPARKRARFIKRLTPITLVGRATPAGLEELAGKVLAPWFHAEGVLARKFAIRPSLRYHGGELTRDEVIRMVARAVGEGHSVDLKGFDVLILVEVYKTTVGMSVVERDYEDMKRYNLAEIYQPSSSED